MRSSRKNSTYRRSGPVTRSKAKPEDIAREQSRRRRQRKLYDTPKVNIQKSADTTETFSAMMPNEVEDFVRRQERRHNVRGRAAADRIWGGPSR